MLRELLSENRAAIISKWTKLIIETYAAETANFLELEKDQFSNPVGYIISNNASAIYDEIINQGSKDKINALMDEIVKIRAVQNFPPSIAVNFIYLLKTVIKENIVDLIIEKNLISEYLNFELAIDRVALNAFDLYMNSREKIFRIRVDELKSNAI